MPSAEARALANRRYANERGAVGRHVVSVVKRYRVWTDEETAAIAAAIGERTRSDQGLPPSVVDPAVLAKVAAILTAAAP
jgi:hypothetical protein